MFTLLCVTPAARIWRMGATTSEQLPVDRALESQRMSRIVSLDLPFVLFRKKISIATLSLIGNMIHL
jgi:hypothetical protein